MKAGAVSIRYRNGEQRNGISLADAIAEIKETISARAQV
jgi:threonyl-tRNA synthetase